jgi:hypothetical protein
VLYVYLAFVDSPAETLMKELLVEVVNDVTDSELNKKNLEVYSLLILFVA